ncbi:MAG: hypothetical protein ACE5IT_03475 [bacterium]
MGQNQNEELPKAERDFLEASEEANKFTGGIKNGSYRIPEITTLKKLCEVENRRKETGRKYYRLLFKKEGCDDSLIDEWLKKSGFED